MKRLRWLKENSVTRDLASHLYRKPRTRRAAATGLRRVLRRPEPLEPRLLLATFLVTNTNNSGAGSLRAAIADANIAAGFDVVNFLIPGSGPHVISPQRTNPADPLSVAMPISSPMLIDGYSQAGASPNTMSEGNDADIRIRLDGALAGAGAGGLFIDGGGVTIRGVAVTRFEDGVIIRGGGGGNTIAGNFIGLDPLGNPLGNLGRGVTIEGSPGNTVGGADPAARNVISANEEIGVRLVQSGSVDNVIRGNYIGTDPSGTLDRGNGGSLGAGGSGIEVGVFSIDAGYASRTIIGGTAPGAGNLISGNAGSGIVLLGTPSRDNLIQGNYIGTIAAGDAPLGNDRHGILLTLPVLQSGQPASGSASNNTIGGTEPGAGNVISGNKRSGIVLFGSAVNNVIQGNFVGTNALGNSDVGNTLEGILLSDAADINVAGPSDTQIGGTSAGAGNVISGNDQNGVALLGAGTQFNELLGNRIGVNASGDAAIANSLHGVTISFATAGGNAASNNFIGGITASSRNIISGNGQAGVAMFGTGATGNLVQGNYIGTNMTGTAAIPNVNDGVRIGGAGLDAGPSGNFVGGTLPGAGNLISGNMDNGVEVAGATTSGNRIEGNLIGTIVGGSGARPNQNHGVLVENAPNTVIGGTAAGARNVISGNGGSGIRLNSAGATGTVIAGNYIGVTADADAGLPNQASGVRIGANASSNMIGGTTADAANVIAYNADRGVVIESGNFNAVRRNSIYDNIGIGVDLNNNQDSLNDPDDVDAGANELQNWPELTGLAVVGGVQKASGFMDGKSNTTYTLDIYFNGGILPTSLGEGKTYVTSILLTTDADGFVNFTVDLPLLVPNGTFVTVAATDPDGNTSEFSHDADLDALYDHWETGSQIDGNFDGIGDNFVLAGADPLRKDLYVEVDAMVGRAPTLATLARVVDAFAAAPNIYNPNGSGGIALHVDLDDTNVVLQDFPADFADFHVIKAAVFGTANEFGATRDAKRLAYRYCIFGNTRAGGSSSGRGEIGGNDFMVTLGAWATPGGTPDQQAGTFMHELGHTLGLRHGGADDLQYKPNYYSVMNYMWQTPDPLYQEFWRLDYSLSALPALNENDLDEMAGIGGPVDVRTMVRLPVGAELVEMNGPIDWSRDDQDFDMVFDNDLHVVQNVNDDGSLDLLNGFEDWSHIVYGFRQNSQFADGADPGPADVELSYDMYLQTHEELLDDTTADFDGDLDVDGADFLKWQRGLGKSNPNISDGDADVDDDVDGVDLYVWQQKFGLTEPVISSASVSALAPSSSVAESPSEDGVDLAPLAGLWPGVDHHRTIRGGLPPQPAAAVAVDARTVAFARWINSRVWDDEDDAELTVAGDEGLENGIDEALFHGPLSDGFKSRSGALGRPEHRPSHANRRDA